MTNLQQAAEQALKVLEEINEISKPPTGLPLPAEIDDAMENLRQALAQPKQEPVALLERDPSIGRLRVTYEDAVTELDEGVYPLYIAPPERGA